MGGFTNVNAAPVQTEQNNASAMSARSAARVRGAKIAPAAV
tara:strand:- start:684 stop:806 length:123 start_codon:yes stop_codon:yes gene_type:complete